jgi:hypothetical protein
MVSVEVMLGSAFQGLLFPKYFSHKTPLLSTYFDCLDIDPAFFPRFSNYGMYLKKSVLLFYIDIPNVRVLMVDEAALVETDRQTDRHSPSTPVFVCQ